MDQYQSSGSGSGSGSGSNANANANTNTNTSNKADEWLQLSSLMLEGLSEEQLELDDLDDLAGLRGFSGASTETANSNSNSAGAQNSISNNNNNNNNNINHVGDMTVSQMAIATQQAILASSLLANQSFLAALGNPMNPMMAATPMMPMLAQPYYPSPLPPILPPPVHSSSSASAQPRTASSTGPKPASEKTESELDKRRRNTAASARFRAKKKEKQQMMEQTTKQLSDKVSLLERRLQEYEMEIQMLRQEIDQKDGADNNKKRLRDLYEENGLQFNEGIAAAGQGIEATLFGGLGGSGGFGGFDDGNESDGIKAESLTDIMGLDMPSDLWSTRESPDGTFSLSSLNAPVSTPPSLTPAPPAASSSSSSIAGSTRTASESSAPAKRQRTRK
ncbi:hypothetical protein HDU79_006625 [Rhizoclosmatium sp. JEL0117]|nr:hypothetical protein HDU79_006625 [Rhizoclosmatium sp. JEL0117]